MALTLTPVDAADIPDRQSKKGAEYQATVRAFVTSNQAAAKVETNGAKPNTVHNGLKNALNVLGLGGIEAILRDGTVYLRRK